MLLDERAEERLIYSMCGWKKKEGGGGGEGKGCSFRGGLRKEEGVRQTEGGGGMRERERERERER